MADGGASAAGGGVRGPGMFCKGCRYDLRGIVEIASERGTADRVEPDGKRRGSDGPSCPECGREFDPSRRRTYDRKPGGLIWVFLATRVVPSVVAALVIVWLVALGWIPLPGPLTPGWQSGGWSLWHWRGDRYGYVERSMRVPGSASVDVRLFVWADAVRGVEGFAAVADDEGRPAGRERVWRVRRSGDVWRISAEAGVRLEEVMAGWNATRGTFRFGLFTYGDPQPPSRRFAFEGGEAEALTAMSRAWGVHMQPGRPRHRDGHAWVWDPWREAVARVPDKAAWLHAGYDVRDVWTPRHPGQRFEVRWWSPEPGWYRELFPSAGR